MVQPVPGGLPTIPASPPEAEAAAGADAATPEVASDPQETETPAKPREEEIKVQAGGMDFPGDESTSHMHEPRVDAPPSSGETGEIPGISAAPGVETSAKIEPEQPSPVPEASKEAQAKPSVKPRWLGKAKSTTSSEKVEKADKLQSEISKAGKARFTKTISVLAAFILLSRQRTSGVLRKLFRGILPDESLFTIPASTMVFVAVAVAVVVATAGGMMYFQRGRSTQYQVLYEQALAAAQQAASGTDPVEIRTDWEISLHFLNQAEGFLVTPDSELLRAQARQALDSMDQIERLDFKQAITGGMGANARITRMVATETDLYLLDASNGNVTRLILTGHGYERDPDFMCTGSPTIGPIIDLSPLPKGNNLKATVLAMDANTNLLYCIPGSLPVANSPAPPQRNWGGPTGLTYDSGDLYVLDPPANAVWIYRNINLSQEPRLFFGSQVPFMLDVVDLAVNRNDLYLLHSDGHITTCTYSGLQESPTRCQEPTTFYDSRIGRQNGPIIHDAPFNQILFTQPPDPSIYLLDPVNKAIYHFSLRLTFQRQFRSLTDLGQAEATAFTISPSRIIFLAIENRVFYAELP
jgi:hypothetical protein